MDLIPEGYNYTKIKFYIRKYNLDISHFTNEPWNKGKSVKIVQRPLEEVLVKNSELLNQTSLKKIYVKFADEKEVMNYIILMEILQIIV